MDKTLWVTDHCRQAIVAAANSEIRERNVLIYSKEKGVKPSGAFTNCIHIGAHCDTIDHFAQLLMFA